MNEINNEDSHFEKTNNYEECDIIEINDIDDEDSYLNYLESLRNQCKLEMQNYQEENLKKDYPYLFSNSYIFNITDDEDDFVNHLNMNNPEEAELFFDSLQNLINRNFIENRKYEYFDDYCDVEYDKYALNSARKCETDIDDLKEKYKKKYYNITEENLNISIDEKKEKKSKKTIKIRNSEPPKDIIHKNYNNYLNELEEKRKNEKNNSKFIAKPCPVDILKPKYDSIVEEAKLRQKENVNSRLNMWKNILQPFSFDSRDTEKYRKKMEMEALKEKELNDNKNKKVNKKIIFKLVQSAAEDGYERYKRMKEADNKAHLTPEHIFHPNIPKDIPSFYKINSQKYKELKEKKLLNKYKEEKKEIERKANYEKLMLQKIRMNPKNTYKNTRSSILRNKAILEKKESDKLYNEVEEELRQDKEKDQSKIKQYVQDKLKDLYLKKYTYDMRLKEKEKQEKKKTRNTEKRI